MMSKIFVLSLSLLPLLISASNDWSIPCLDGWCSYDIPSSETSMAGTMTITGSTNAISDVTSAAGWEILNCTADADAQDIRIVCTGDEASCSHLFQNGAEHTVVRLPPDCSPVPFARVSQCAESDDQSLPERISSRIMRRDGTTPPVHALSFDTKFAAVPSTQHGNVSMLVFGSTIPGFTGNATMAPAGSRRRSRLVNKRGFISTLFGEFNKTKSTDIPPINIDKTFNIFNETISCSANEQAKLSVDVAVKVNAQVTIGTVLAGSIIPPKISEFGLFSDVSADLDGGLGIDASIAGEVDTGKVPLFSVGLPGLSIPGILSLGPTFEIDAQAKATIDLDVDMAVDLAYSFSDLQLFFPPSDGQQSTAVVTPKDTPLKLSASPDIASNATLEAHLIPTLKFGLTVLNLASADIFLDLDTFAALDLGLEAGANASIDSTGSVNASAQVSGCVDVNGGVSVNAGAEGSLFGLFDDSTQVALFSKDFDFFKKCFQESASTTVSSVGSTTSSALATATSSASATATYSLSSYSGSASSLDSYSSATQSYLTAIPSDAYYTPSTSSFVPSSSSAVIVSSILSESSSVAMTSSSIAESSAIPSASSTSISAASAASVYRTKRQSRRSRLEKPSNKLAKRDFQCLAPDIATAASIVDQLLSSSSFVS